MCEPESTEAFQGVGKVDDKAEQNQGGPDASMHDCDLLKDGLAPSALVYAILEGHPD